MSNLACNIVLYRPNLDLLVARYSYWQPGALLHQAEALIARCLADFHEYSLLDYRWHEFQSELEAQEKKLGLYSQPVEHEVFQREAEPPQEEGEAASHQGSMEQPEMLGLSEQGESAEGGGAGEPAGIRTSLDLRAEAVQRKKELAGPGRPFALNEQRDLTLKRLCRDYEAAVDRALVAEQGLGRLYGRTEAASPLPSEAETLGTSISNLAIWIRDAVDWIDSYHQREHPFTRVVSIRSLLNRNAWALLKHARDNYALKLQIPVELFRGHDNCRLTGVAAALVGEAGAVPWSAVVRVPEEAVFERSGQSVDTGQADRPPCLLGRVENRRSPRPPEVGGTRTLLNASPIGRSTQGGLWSVELMRPAGASTESFAHIEDVVLELDVVGLPHRSGG